MTHTDKYQLRLKEYLKQAGNPLLIKLLINGLTVEMTYQNGLLNKVIMVDQNHFEVDVTQVVRISVDVPDKILFKGLLKVRAHVIHTFSDFEKLNRNGLYLHHKDLTKKILQQQMDYEQRKLRVIVSNIVDIFGLDNDSGYNEIEQVEFLKNQGFHVVYYEQIENSIEGIHLFYETFMEYHRQEIGYSVSGLQILSADSHDCNEGFILPFSSDEAILTVDDICPEVIPSGRIEPIVRIKAIDLAGERYYSLRMHGFSLIKLMDIRIGDQVLMSDVQTIIGVEIEKRTGTETCFVLPEFCPNCGDKVKNDGEQLYCTNSDCRNKPVFNREQHGIKGKTVVITGTLSIRRYDFRKLIEQAGGVLAGAVTNQTDYLLMGSKGVGTVKYRKAKSLKVPIITEEQIRLMIE
ncbi:BRCT domain-containing protein [Bacillus sp. FJAT-27986]|uniref:BRCT domain-containing protein n=1 Tax=Bacillus sp. FJAT-27986 TaxID=1743146 RepID=UPI00080AE1CC|nr:BRCT domain-containing protein [Bacillus sp. FJAT-27986]OCA90171.1 hypothetical protein A8L44_04425 [Bacillus sp. FJAT-27986]